MGLDLHRRIPFYTDLFGIIWWPQNDLPIAQMFIVGTEGLRGFVPGGCLPGSSSSSLPRKKNLEKSKIAIIKPIWNAEGFSPECNLDDTLFYRNFIDPYLLPGDWVNKHAEMVPRLHRKKSWSNVLSFVHSSCRGSGRRKFE